jgi:hypothetical protein
MYQFTVGGSNVDAIREKFIAIHGGAKMIWQRNYRWGNVWGIHNPAATHWEETWRAEIRTTVLTDGDDQLLEQITPIACAAPPMKVDDIWEDQVMYQNNITCGNLISITGNLLEIQELCRIYGILIAPSISLYIEKEMQNNNSERQPSVPAKQLHSEEQFQKKQMKRGPSQHPGRSGLQQGGSYPRSHVLQNGRPRVHTYSQLNAQPPLQDRASPYLKFQTFGAQPSNAGQYAKRQQL